MRSLEELAFLKPMPRLGEMIQLGVWDMPQRAHM